MFNGYTQWEVRKRDQIQDRVDAGDVATVKKLTAEFFVNKKRRVMRRTLLRTVKGWVSAMNKGS